MDANKPLKIYISKYNFVFVIWFQCCPRCISYNVYPLQNQHIIYKSSMGLPCMFPWPLSSTKISRFTNVYKPGSCHHVMIKTAVSNHQGIQQTLMLRMRSWVNKCGGISCTRWTAICFLTIRRNKTKVDIINRGELEENISGISCMRLEWSQGDGRAEICHTPSCTVNTGETFWKLANFAQIAAFISSILNKNGFKSIPCQFIHEFSMNYFEMKTFW